MSTTRIRAYWWSWALLIIVCGALFCALTGGCQAGVQPEVQERAADRHYQMGLEYQRQGEERKARQAFREVLKLEVDHPGARGALGYEKIGDEWVDVSKIVRLQVFNRDRHNILEFCLQEKSLGKIHPQQQQQFALSPGKVEVELKITEAVGDKGDIIPTAQHSTLPLPVHLKGGAIYQLTVPLRQPRFARALGGGNWTRLFRDEVPWLCFARGRCERIISREMVPISNPVGGPIEVEYQALSPHWLEVSGLARKVANEGMYFPEGLILPREVEAHIGTERTVFTTEEGTYQEYPWIRITRLPGSWLYLEEGKKLLQGEGECPYSERRKPPHIPAGTYLKSGALYLTFTAPATLAGIKGEAGTEMAITPTDGRLLEGSITVTAQRQANVGNFIAEKATSFQVTKTTEPAAYPLMQARIMQGKIIPQYLPFVWRTKGYAAMLKGKQEFYYQTDLGWVMIKEM